MLRNTPSRSVLARNEVKNLSSYPAFTLQSSHELLQDGRINGLLSIKSSEGGSF